MRSRVFLDHGETLAEWEGEFVGAFLAQRIEDVGHGSDAAFEGNLLALQPLRIPRSVPAFVVA